MRQSNSILAACILALAGFAVSASNAQAQDITEARTEINNALEGEFSSALSEALSLYELEVQSAARAWYPGYAEAAAAHEAVARPEVSDRLTAALQRRGLTMADLNDYAAANPEFVSRENRRAEARLQAIRPTVFAVLGRIAPAVDGAIVGNQVTEYASALAAPVSLPTATRVAKER